MLVLAAYNWLWFIVAPVALVFAWRMRSRPVLRACLLPPLALISAYSAATLASLPFGFVKVSQVGEAICAMAARGAFAQVTPENPPAGLANIGPGGAQKLRDMERYLRTGCDHRMRPGNFGSVFHLGSYVLVICARTELAAVSLELGFHPVLDFVLSIFFELPHAFQVDYSAFISGDFSNRIIPGR